MVIDDDQKIDDIIIINTLGGRNPAPPGMYKPSVNNGGKLPTSTGEFAGFLNHHMTMNYIPY